MNQGIGPSQRINKRQRQTVSHITPERREKADINIIRNEKGKILEDITKIKKTTNNYFANVCASSLENAEEIDRVLAKYEFPKLNQNDVKTLFNPIKLKEQ